MIFQVGRIALISGLLLGTLQLKAQNAEVTPADMIRLRSVTAEPISSPKYAVDVRGMSVDRDGRRDWLMLKVIYDTAPKWIDEITFTFYVVLQGDLANLPQGAQPLNLFSGTVTVVNVPQARKGETTMFLDPYTLMRYGKPTHVAVVISINGQPAAGMAEPESSAASKWWTKQTPNATPLLSRDKTPYALIEIDKQNTIKP